MSFLPVIILGCGFTGRRVAKFLRLRNVSVFSAARQPERLSELAALGVNVGNWNLEFSRELPSFPKNAVVLHSVPEIPPAQSAILHGYITRLEPYRVVYLSTTSVYGTQTNVDAASPVQPADEKGQRRVDEEEFVQSGGWSSLVLRPAAIYGPHRGVHTHLRLGREPRTSSGMVSRIHVDDLAAHAELALLSHHRGVYPVADEHPCSSNEISEFCRRVLNLPEDGKSRNDKLVITGRRVDGSKIRELLELGLKYPGYESGILASIAEETILAA